MGKRKPIIKKKVGLDIHGVIDSNPKLFKELTNELSSVYEIHILTGTKIDRSVLAELNGYGIIYDKIFSILDYHDILGTHVWSDENGWWIQDDIWNKTKAEYCKRNKIELHIDDTLVYGNYFETPFSLYNKNCRLSNFKFVDKIDRSLLDVFRSYGMLS